MTAYLKGVEMPVKHTDKERRRLAENLRGGYDVTWNANGLFWLNGTLFGMDICARSEEKIRNGLRHLAAFIEPEPERTCRNVGGEDGTNGEYYDFACSECGFCCDLPDPSYCPSCGAKVVEK